LLFAALIQKNLKDEQGKSISLLLPKVSICFRYLYLYDYLFPC